MVILEMLLFPKLLKLKPKTKKRLKEFGLDIDGIAEPFQKIGEQFMGKKRR